MAKVGIFFGTDTGRTRMIAKTIAKKIGPDTAKPVNIRTAIVEDLLDYDVLILGTPTYGEGELPGKSTGNQTESWEEFIPKLNGHDFNGKKVALYGLGNQKSYGKNFGSAVRYLYDAFTSCGAEIIGGAWDTGNYQFIYSKAVIDDKFVGLILDEETQKELTDERLDKWLEGIRPVWT
ncbi:flavodoxin [Methylotuvimicrobium sp.]|uniref:flavodoxin n=1 Tax=Methylotuvimicrobium sp. TaxID=2822413 RepID=UPI003D6582CE